MRNNSMVEWSRVPGVVQSQGTSFCRYFAEQKKCNASEHDFLPLSIDPQED